MIVNFNDTFKKLLREFNLPDDLSFSVEIPKEVQEILEDEIVETDLGITLKSFNKLYKATGNWENQSIIEDNENHFHVDWCIDPPNDKNAFMLGVKTLILLALKFKNEKLSGLRFWYSFQTPELGNLWAKDNDFDEQEDEHLISDRLSFYKMRKGEEVIEVNIYENLFWAVLTIDI
ncbi:hypothetical protein [Botryobacter ruber]|uniref:hypothetical protein n=1 Tax=Botryobacter ruber TaxID=2171629 RepID=UPI000E0A8502|nr:hypothetical protein [Botryobacter ruber]